MSCFLELKRSCFDQLPVSIGLRLMPDGQGLLSRVDGGAHIFTHPLGANRPGLVQEFDVSSVIYFMHKVNPAHGDGQLFCRNQLPQVCRQARDPNAPSHLSGCLALQGGWLVKRVIPACEGWSFGLHVCQAGELLTRPESNVPQTVNSPFGHFRSDIPNYAPKCARQARFLPCSGQRAPQPKHDSRAKVVRSATTPIYWHLVLDNPLTVLTVCQGGSATGRLASSARRVAC